MKAQFIRIFLTCAVLFGLLLHPRTAIAQGQIELERLQVDIWPEYDRPDVLVIYHITLAAEANLPARLAIKIPRLSGAPFNVAMQDVDGLLYNLEYAISPVDDDWVQISFMTPSPDIQIEYYDPGLKKSGAQRSFEYRWPAEYTVRSMTIQLQRPNGAENMQTIPEMGSGRLGQDGLTYFTAVVGRVEAAVPVVIRFTYEKADDTLSSKAQPVEPVEAISAKAPGRTTFQEALPIILGIFGALLLAAGFFWYWQSNRDQSGASRKRHTHPAASPGRNHAGGARTTGYCHQCGKAAQPGDVFCRACGARLRNEGN